MYFAQPCPYFQQTVNAVTRYLKKTVDSNCMQHT